MPRNVDPGTITVGPGKEVPGESPLTLGGAGMSLPQHIGEVEGEIPGADAGAALAAHVDSGKAHPASAIYTVEGPSTLYTNDVEGQLDELAGALPPEPPKLGYVHSHLTFTGIPDWGPLRLNDRPLTDTVPISTSNGPDRMYPYYWVGPSPTQDAEFYPGGDPRSDPYFGLNVPKAGAGAYTRPVVGPGPLVRTTMILERTGSENIILVAGALYPADRGVLALLHWPADDGAGNPADISDFLGQDLVDRCKCAILLGQGILGAGPCEGGECDGGSGGIFAMGEDANGEYDPFAFPGQATGQYDLMEIANGVSNLDGSPLKPPWDDLNGSGVPASGWQRVQNDTVPGPGQVRLGTDPGAGEPAPASGYGIPVIGAEAAYYSPPPGLVLGDIVLDPLATQFRFRLPYLDDYTQASGLKHTPGGVAGTETTAKEKFRYFIGDGGAPIDPAGTYDDFPEDNYAWQVARYRIGCYLKYNGTINDYEEHGTYFLMHFKREADFEAFVRDGTMPDHPTLGYEVYSAQPVFLPDPSIEDYGNRVNEETSTTVFAPAGPAPDYGYKAMPYHTMRVNVFEDPTGWEVDPGDFFLYQSTFSALSTMFLSGVEYWLPRDLATGNPAANLTVEVTLQNFWQYSYRTDDRPMSGALGNTPPVLLSSPNPAFIGLAPFAFQSGSYTTGTGAAGSFYTDSSHFLREQRIEIPFTHLNGMGAWSDAAGPTTADFLLITGLSYPTIDFLGDSQAPSVSIDAAPRLFLRKPLGNAREDADRGIQPDNFGTQLGHGQLLGDSSGDTILFHSTSFVPGFWAGSHGNFRQPGVTPQPAYPNLVSVIKDCTEDLYDEVYRYWLGAYSGGGALDTLYNGPAELALIGPGLGGWNKGPIETPVQIGIVPSAIWSPMSVVQNDLHTLPLDNVVPGYLGESLQVAGLPDRNPRLDVGAAYPFAPGGMLLYPQHGFHSGYSPAGPDYTSLGGIREYVRVFDATYTGSVLAAGQPFFVLRVYGLQLQDFEYTAPGPGTLWSTEGIAIEVKVPGLTTWMDVGRVDGSGPSKQDVLLDGAGCKVIGPDTYDSVSGQTQHVYSQVKVHVGPAVNLFKMVGFGAGSGIHIDDVGKVPVLVRVRYNEQAASFNLVDAYNPSTRAFLGVPGPGVGTPDVRGIVALRVMGA